MSLPLLAYYLLKNKLKSTQLKNITTLFQIINQNFKFTCVTNFFLGWL